MGAKTLDERLFYINKCADEHLSAEALKRSIKADDFRHQGKAPNNYLPLCPRASRLFASSGRSRTSICLILSTWRSLVFRAMIGSDAPSAPAVSRLIRDTVAEGLIEPYNPNSGRKYATYVPIWA